MGDNSCVPFKLTSLLDFHRDLTALLYRHDPLSLAAAGAPKDEYEPVVNDRNGSCSGHLFTIALRGNS
jgi:hypothetical protein